MLTMTRLNKTMKALSVAGCLAGAAALAQAQTQPQALGPLNPGQANASIARLDHAGVLPPTLVPAPHEELFMTPLSAAQPVRLLAAGELAAGAERLGVFVLMSDQPMSQWGSGVNGAGFFLFSAGFPPMTGSEGFVVPMPGPNPFTNSQIGTTLPDFLGPGSTFQLAAVSPLTRRLDGVPAFQAQKRLTQISFQTINSAAFGVSIRFGLVSSNPVSFDYLVNVTTPDGTKMGGVGISMASVVNGKPLLTHAVLFNREAGHIVPGTDSVTQEWVDVSGWTATDKRTGLVLPGYKLINAL